MIPTTTLLTENSAKPCDIGTPLPTISAEFPRVDFSHVDPVYPDKTTPAGARYAYSRNAITARAKLALSDLHARPEKLIAVVSHSGFMRQGMTGFWFFNADFRIFDFEEGIKGPGEPPRLKQWDMTKQGGLGWSWEEPVEVGDGLPDGGEKRGADEIPEADKRLPEQ